jgi:methionyl-tRNA formyltransferase
LIKGEQQTGITVIKINEKIDAGEILGQEKITIDPNENLPELSQKMARISAGLLLKILPAWLDKKITPQKQDDAKATFCEMIERGDGRIIWSDDAESIYNRYRAFIQWPGIFTFWEQEEGSLKRIKLNRIKLIRTNPEVKHHIGEVFQIGEDIGVQTTLGVIIIEEIQVEGRPSMSAKDFVNGYPNFIGSLLK